MRLQSAARLMAVTRQLAGTGSVCGRALQACCTTTSTSTAACATSPAQATQRPAHTRSFASDAQHHAHEVDEINSLFVEAREEIEYAAEDSETVYFNDSVAEAKVLVDKCTEKWAALLAKLPDDERGRMQRSMGLKIEQLKAEYEVLAATHS